MSDLDLFLSKHHVAKSTIFAGLTLNQPTVLSGWTIVFDVQTSIVSD